MKTILLRIALLFAFMQPASISVGQTITAKPKAPQVPIDGGISALVAAGIALGAAKVLRKNNQPQG